MQIDFWEIIKDMTPTILNLWPLWTTALALVVSGLVINRLEKGVDKLATHRRFKKGGKWRSDRDLLYWLRGMQPSEFGKYVADLFTRLGYKAEVVGRSHDGGIDVIAEK